MKTYCEENRARALWQSARTKDGHVADLPYPELVAWPQAIRDNAEWDRRKREEKKSK